MLPALAPEKGGDPQSGEDRRRFMPLIYFYFNIFAYLNL